METLSTTAFYQELAAIDFTKEGSRLRVFNVDLDPSNLVSLINEGNSLAVVKSSDGAISNVKEILGSNPLDNSQSSRYFLLHTDGQYLPKVPEMVILYCVHPGISEMPTVFIDTQAILRILQKSDKLQEAQEYVFVFKNKKGLEFRRNLIEQHPTTQELLMNIAIASPQCHLEPLPTSNKHQNDADEFYQLLGEIVQQHLLYITHDWKKNDLVVFDNLRLVHGRGLPKHTPTQVAADQQRHLYRIWLSHK